MSSLTLPNEIIYLILECVIPAGRRNAIAIPASDPITKTLLSLARTSLLIYPVAIRYLYTHCLYVDSFGRLADLHSTLISSLSLYSEDSILRKSMGKKRLRPVLPLLEYSTSLYLGPFPQIYAENVEQLRPICNLLHIMAPHLKRLILSIPPLMKIDGENYFWSDLQEQYRVYDSLSELNSLEVFCAVQDNSGMARDEGEYRFLTQLHWPNWPNLRVLSLTGCTLNEHHLNWMAENKTLERWVLVAFEGWDSFDLKQSYKERRRQQEEMERMDNREVQTKEGSGQARATKNEEAVTMKKQEILRIDAEGDEIPECRGKENWKDDDRLQINAIQTPVSSGADSEIPQYYITCEWVKEKFISGDERFVG